MEASDATQPSTPSPVEGAVETEDLDGKTVSELRDLAEARGLEGVSNLRKDDLVEAISTGVVPVTGSARVAVAYPHTRFEHGIEGVPVLSAELTEEPVSATNLQKLRELADQYGVPLREVAG